MPVTQQTPYNAHVANGVTDTFGFDFLLLLASDLQVRVDGEVILTGYTVNGVGDQDGGDVEFDTPPGNTLLVELERKIPLTRSTDYQYAGDLPEAVVDADFDRVWLALQDAVFLADQAIRTPLGDPISPMVIPSVADRANKFFGFGPDGEAMASDAIGVPLNALMTLFLVQATAAAARGVLNAQEFDADTAKTDVAQTFTKPQRTTPTTDNDGSFALAAGQKFYCTPSGAVTLTFTDIASQAGQDGIVMLYNSGGHTVSAHANTKVPAGLLATISAAGTYKLGYECDGTNVYVTGSGALS